jgi:hypothetical protein
MDGVSVVIVAILVLLAVGIVVGPLLRLRKLLQKPPPGPHVQEPPDTEA